MRWMKWIALLLLPGALIAGGIMAVAGAVAFSNACKSDDPYLEGLRTRTVCYVIWTFGLQASAAVCRAMLGIFDRENKGRAPSPLVGDRALAGGPSIGPGQVYRATAIALGLVPPDTTREEYEAMAKNEGLMVAWAVKVFHSKYVAAKGDVGLAIRMYNGSGDAAEHYRSEVLSFIAETWGEDPLGPQGGVAA